MAQAAAREQLILELINRARMDPLGEAKRYGIDLNKDLPAGTLNGTPKQVLAFNGFLNEAADAHSQWMLDTDTFSHTGVNGTSPGDRMAAAGYVFSGNWTWGENIAMTYTTGSINGDAEAPNHHRNLFLSAGHRENILNGDFREIGIGTLTGQYTQNKTTFNAAMTTEAFATSGSNHFVTGVAYADADGNAFYSIGEGQGGLTVQLFQSGLVKASSSTETAGGYAIGTTITGTTEVRFSGGGLAAAAGAQVSLGSSNVKVDLVDGHIIQSNVTAALTQQAADLRLLGISNVNGTGNALANVIVGNAGANTLSGGGGNDSLSGGAGKDTLVGGAGNDVLRGGGGADRLTGSDGADRFVFKTLGEITGDTITDFVAGTDKINLSAIDAVAGGSNDAFTFDGDAFSGPGSLRVSHVGTTSTLVEGDRDGNGTVDFTLTLLGNLTLHGTDFVL